MRRNSRKSASAKPGPATGPRATLRDRRIAERLAVLQHDATDEGEDIRPESARQFEAFFHNHPELGLPKITLTPDGTLRARWIVAPQNFVAIEFTGGHSVRLVAELPRDRGKTAKFFATESVASVVPIARAIGAGFT